MDEKIQNFDHKSQIMMHVGKTRRGDKIVSVHMFPFSMNDAHIYLKEIFIIKGKG